MKGKQNQGIGISVILSEGSFIQPRLFLRCCILGNRPKQNDGLSQIFILFAFQKKTVKPIFMELHVMLYRDVRRLEKLSNCPPTWRVNANVPKSDINGFVRDLVRYREKRPNNVSNQV